MLCFSVSNVSDVIIAGNYDSGIFIEDGLHHINYIFIFAVFDEKKMHLKIQFKGIF